MEELRDKLEDFLSERLYQVIISNPRKRDGATFFPHINIAITLRHDYILLIYL